MNEIDEYSQELMLMFLKQNYPIKRLKDGKHFKRGVIIDSTNVFLSPKSELHKLGIQLTYILDDMFSFSKLEINMVVLKYLNII